MYPPSGGQAGYAGGSPNFQELRPMTSNQAQPSQPSQPLPNFQQQKPLNQLNQGLTSPQAHNQYQNSAVQQNNNQQTPGSVPMSQAAQQNAFQLPQGTQGQAPQQQQMPHPLQQFAQNTQQTGNHLAVMQSNPMFQNYMKTFPPFQQGQGGQGQAPQPNSGGMPQNAGQQPLWGQNPSQFPGNNIAQLGTTNV